MWWEETRHDPNLRKKKKKKKKKNIVAIMDSSPQQSVGGAVVETASREGEGRRGGGEGYPTPTSAMAA